MAVEELCRQYQRALNQENIPPLIAIAALILDFLCIHPFRDGNGRVSRLLTLLALYQHGYEVGRYISLERLIEDSREDLLRRSPAQFLSAGTTANTNRRLGSILCFAIIRRAYVELEERAGQIKAPSGGPNPSGCSMPFVHNRTNFA